MPLSPKLGPRARTLASTSAHKIVGGLIEIDLHANLRTLGRQLKKAGAHVSGSLSSANMNGFVRVEVPADQLNAVANVSDVLYVEADPHRY